MAQLNIKNNDETQPQPFLAFIGDLRGLYPGPLVEKLMQRDKLHNEYDIHHGHKHAVLYLLSKALLSLNELDEFGGYEELLQVLHRLLNLIISKKIFEDNPNNSLYDIIKLQGSFGIEYDLTKQKLSIILYLLRREAEAFQILDRLSFVDAQNVITKIMEKGQFSYEEYPKELQKLCDKMLEQGIAKKIAYYNKGYSFFSIRKYEDAIDSFKIYLDLDLYSFNDEVFYKIGFAYEFLDNYQEAVDSYKKCLNINPKNEDAYFRLAVSLVKIDRLSEAEQALRKGLEIAPNSPYKEMLSELYTKIHKPIVCLPNFVECDSKNPWREVIGKAKFLWSIGKKEESIVYLSSFPELYQNINIEAIIPKKYALDLIMAKLGVNSITNRNNHSTDQSLQLNKQIENLSEFYANIINAYKLYDNNIILKNSRVEDIMHSDEYGIKFIPRKGKTSKLVKQNRQYDILYYRLEGTRYALDYNRCFIAANSNISTSSLPKEIYDAFLKLSEERAFLDVPVALKIKHKFQIHGMSFIDNYAWLQNMSQNESDIVNLHIDRENKYLEEYFEDQQSSVFLLVKEINSRTHFRKETNDPREGNQYYFRYEEGKAYRIYYRIKDEVNAKEEIILDINQLAKEKRFVTISNIYISEEHKFLSYGIDYIGNELYEINIIDLVTKEHKNSIITNVSIDDSSTLLVWHKNIRGFFCCVDKHPLFYNIDNNRQEFAGVYLDRERLSNINLEESTSGKYLIVTQNFSTGNSEIYIVSLYSLSLNIQYVKQRDNNIYYNIEHNEEYIYARTNDLGNNFRITRTPIDWLGALKYEECEEYIPQDSERYLESFCTTQNYLILNYLNNGSSEIKLIRFCDKKEQLVKFKQKVGIVYGYTNNYQEDKLMISYSSFMDPEIIYSYDFETDALSIVTEQVIDCLVNNDDYEVDRIWANNNGVQIPISLFYKKSLFKNNGTNPLYLHGYGSYGYITKTYSDSSIISLVDRGFIYAIAHVRGSGDLGHDWWLAAKKLNKKNTIDDFIICTEYLIEKKYTSLGNIVTSGGSAGGVLVAAAANMRPELYKAVIAKVPLVDLLNCMTKFKTNIGCQFEEFGDGKNLEDFEYMRSYCPYMNIKKQLYPSIYVTNGLNDQRVPYYGPLKWVAKLREFNTSNNPILIKTQKKQGHFMSSNKYEVTEEIAKQYAFIFKVFGIDITKESNNITPGAVL